MNALAPPVAPIPGPPIVTVAMNVAAALAPAGIALDVLVILGAIVVLVARDSRRPTSVARQPSPEATTEQERPPLSVETAIRLGRRMGSRAIVARAQSLLAGLRLSIST